MERHLEELKNLEYETQFFGCSSDDVFEGIECVIKCRIEASVKGMVSALKEFCKETPGQTLEEIEKEVIDYSKRALEQPMKDLKEEIKRDFTIPSNLLLPEDLPQQHQYSKEDEEKIDEDIKSLLKRVEQAKYMKAALKNEYDDLNIVLEETNNKVAELEKIIEENNVSYQNLLNTIDKTKVPIQSQNDQPPV